MSVPMTAEAEEVPERWPHIGAGASHISSIVPPKDHTHLYVIASWRGLVGLMKLEVKGCPWQVESHGISPSCLSNSP